MNDQLLQSLAMNIPVGVALIVITRLFLDFIRNERAKDRGLLENHLSKVAEILNKLVTRIEVMDARLNKP